MTPKQALAFVAKQGVVLESGRGPVPNLAEAIAGETIHGSWWAHPTANDIFLCTRAVRESAEVLVCRLVGGRVTYVHRQVLPALVRLSHRFDARRLAAIQEVHTPQGRHKLNTTEFPAWVPEGIVRAAGDLSDDEAAALLPAALSESKRRV